MVILVPACIFNNHDQSLDLPGVLKSNLCGALYQNKVIGIFSMGRSPELFGESLDCFHHTGVNNAGGNGPFFFFWVERSGQIKKEHLLLLLLGPSSTTHNSDHS